MKNNLIIYYELLSNPRIRSLNDFLASPFYNKNDKHLSIYDLLCSGKFNELDKQNVFEIIFGKGKRYNEQVLRNILNEHGNLVRKFLSIIDDEAKPEVLVRTLKGEHAPSKLIYKNIRRGKKQISRASNAHLQLFDMADLELEYLFEEQKISIERIEQVFQDKIRYFNTHKLLQQLRLVCDYFNLNATLNLDFELSELARIEDILEEAEREAHIEIRIYLRIVRIRLNQDTSENLEEILQLLNQDDIHLLPKDNQAKILKMTIGVCIMLIVRKGKSELNSTLFELQKAGLERGLLNGTNGYIGQRRLKNIIRGAINNDSIDWALDFIRHQSDTINPTEREDAVNFNLGTLFFAQNDYDNALSCFSKVPYDNLYYSSQLRIYLLRIYYEQDETELLLSVISSFRAYLKRNKIHSSGAIISFQKLLTYLKKLHLLRVFEKKKLERLRSKIMDDNPIAEKKWLMSKMDDKYHSSRYF